VGGVAAAGERGREKLVGEEERGEQGRQRIPKSNGESHGGDQSRPNP
jgi:hypothetical protein